MSRDEPSIATKLILNVLVDDKQWNTKVKNLVKDLDLTKIKFNELVGEIHKRGLVMNRDLAQAVLQTKGVSSEVRQFATAYIQSVDQVYDNRVKLRAGAQEIQMAVLPAKQFTTVLSDIGGASQQLLGTFNTINLLGLRMQDFQANLQEAYRNVEYYTEKSRIAVERYGLGAKETLEPLESLHDAQFRYNQMLQQYQAFQLEATVQTITAGVSFFSLGRNIVDTVEHIRKLHFFTETLTGKTFKNLISKLFLSKLGFLDFGVASASANATATTSTTATSVAVTGLTGKIKMLGLVMKTAFITNPVGLAIMGITTAITLLAFNVGGLRDIVWDAIQSFIQWIKQFEIFNGVVAFFGNVVAQIKKVFTGLTGIVDGAIVQVDDYDSIIKALGIDSPKTADEIANLKEETKKHGKVLQTVNPLLQEYKKELETLYEPVQKLDIINQISFEDAKNEVSSLVLSFKQKLSLIPVDEYKRIATTLGSSLEDAIRKYGEGINLTTDQIDYLLEYAKGQLGDFVDFATDEVDRMEQKFGKFKDIFKSPLEDALNVATTSTSELIGVVNSYVNEMDRIMLQSINTGQTLSKRQSIIVENTTTILKDLIDKYNLTQEEVLDIVSFMFFSSPNLLPREKTVIQQILEEVGIDLTELLKVTDENSNAFITKFDRLYESLNDRGKRVKNKYKEVLEPPEVSSVLELPTFSESQIEKVTSQVDTMTSSISEKVVNNVDEVVTNYTVMSNKVLGVFEDITTKSLSKFERLYSTSNFWFNTIKNVIVTYLEETKMNIFNILEDINVKTYTIFGVSIPTYFKLITQSKEPIQDFFISIKSSVSDLSSYTSTSFIKIQQFVSDTISILYQFQSVVDNEIISSSNTLLSSITNNVNKSIQELEKLSDKLSDIIRQQSRVKTSYTSYSSSRSSRSSSSEKASKIIQKVKPKPVPKFYAFAHGGVIDETIIGKGLRSGSTYLFGEKGKEYVVPENKMKYPESKPNNVTVNIYIDGEQISQYVVKELSDTINAKIGKILR